MADDNYRTGPGNPPRSHMWQKGQSGNKKGRPPKKKAETLHECLITALLKERRVQIGDEVKKMSYRELIVERVAELAVKGDKKAIDLIMKIDRQIFETSTGKNRPGGVLLVGLRGHASPEAAARGLNLEQELEEQQAQHRNKIVIPPERIKPG